jgi:hypothetical protein
MARFRVLLPTAFLLVGIELVACGGTESPRLLQSISVTPASADAYSFPNRQVQFTAMGAYSQPPSPSPIPITQSEWSLSDPTMATMSPSGLAQCNPGASGAVAVKASASGSCSGTGCTTVLFSGTAQLSCP